MLFAVLRLKIEFYFAKFKENKLFKNFSNPLKILNKSKPLKNNQFNKIPKKVIKLKNFPKTITQAKVHYVDDLAAIKQLKII